MKKVQLYAFADEASPMIDGQIAAMRRNGLDGLEIRGVDGTNISAISADKAKEVRKKMDDAGLKVWSIGSPIGKIDIHSDQFAAHLESFRHTLALAEILGARNIRLFSWYIPKDEDPEKYRAEVIDKMAQLAQIARGSSVRLCHENEKGIYGSSAERCRVLYEALPEIKGIFDPANFIQCSQDTWEAWQMLKDHICYMHIKDALPDGSVVPAGKGEGNVGKIVREYLNMGGEAMTVEPHLKVFDGLKDLEQKGDASVVGTKYQYPDSDTAFDAACSALKALLA